MTFLSRLSIARKLALLFRVTGFGIVLVAAAFLEVERRLGEVSSVFEVSQGP